ncbi:hypothetical protein KUL17_11470 [Alteromonas sp. KUL17]|nr:hypothetical protein KUL17_11470 [Alteromonas sp. KUL17]
MKINGDTLDIALVPGEFATITRQWKAGDVIELDMPMHIKLIEGHERIEEVRNQVAVKRGPIVYCIESPDLPESASITDVYLPSKSKLSVQKQPSFLGGVTTIEGEILLRKDRGTGMYRDVSQPEFESISTQFVPYFAWSNRGEAEMSVFLPVIWQQ